MYKIYADNTLIYDSTLDDYRIGKGLISLETNRSGSFVFSIYPDHFYYDSFVRLKTVIKITRSGKIIFRGRILNDVTDYWNNKVITCEGELGFFQDSIIRPFKFNGTVTELFTKFITEHNAQVDEFKRFKIGQVTVVQEGKITRYTSLYETTLYNLDSRLINSALGGYFYITHGADGTEEIPTLNYLIDFTKVSTQLIEFGSNLKNYTKTVKAEDLATAVIPLGGEIESESDDKERLTIASVNGGKDYLYDPIAVARYGWIFKTVEHNDVGTAETLLRHGRQDLLEAVNQNTTIELTAVDLHLLNRSIESFSLNDYIRVISIPHNFDATLLCNKQTIDLLKPENDSLTLGYTYSSFTDTANAVANTAARVVTIQNEVNDVSNEVGSVNNRVDTVSGRVDGLENTLPITAVSDPIKIQAGEVGDLSISFPVAFVTAPDVVVASLLVEGENVTGEVAIRRITLNGFHAAIKNTNDNEVTFRLMYAAYPPHTVPSPESLEEVNV